MDLYKEIVTHFINIQRQIEELERKGLTFMFLDYSDFFIENGDMIIKSNTYEIGDYIYSVPHISEKLSLPPEFKMELPIKVSKKFCYYLIGSMFKKLSLSPKLGDISHTPLYWAIERCLEPNPEKRFLILI